MVEKKSQRLVDGRGINDVVVVEDENDVGVDGGNVVDQFRQN